MAKESIRRKPGNAGSVKIFVVGPEWDIKSEGKGKEFCVIRVALPKAFHRFRDGRCVICPINNRQW